MDKTYAIIWVAKDRERSGVGAARFSKPEAEALATDLNQNYAGFLHRPFDAATEDLQQGISALRSSLQLPPCAESISFPEVAAVQAAERVAPVADAIQKKIIELASWSSDVLAAAGE